MNKYLIAMAIGGVLAVGYGAAHAWTSDGCGHEHYQSPVGPGVQRHVTYQCPDTTPPETPPETPATVPPSVPPPPVPGPVLISAEGCYMGSNTYWNITNEGSAALVSFEVNGVRLHFAPGITPGVTFSYVDTTGDRSIHLDLGGPAQWRYTADHECPVRLGTPVRVPIPEPVELDDVTPPRPLVPIPPAAGNAGLK